MGFTLTVNFTLASPNPGSYRVKYWPTSDPLSVSTELISTSPFVAYDLPETSYEGTIETSCGSNVYSSPQSFSITGYYQYLGCGRGSSVENACTDATNISRTFYSDCDSSSFGVDCYVYTDNAGTLLTGYSYIFMNNANWDINPVQGRVLGLSVEQC